jgi:hypothetical protein
MMRSEVDKERKNSFQCHLSSNDGGICRCAKETEKVGRVEQKVKCDFVERRKREVTRGGGGTGSSKKLKMRAPRE